MNNIINYSIIIILTLISFIAIINISKIEQKIKIKGIKIVLFFIILMSYMTLSSFPVKNILNTQILSIKLPRGKKGVRGNRGTTGNKVVCDTCGDDLCLKKILFNITNTYNYWRQLNGLKPYPDTYVIKNEYLKDKILKHCKSEEYQKIIKKYGSNNSKSCPNEPTDLSQYNCGVYDYLFKMWSIWILIILKYKNGSFFLESESLAEIDFDGLIEAEDSFLHKDIVFYNGEKFEIDTSSEYFKIYPMFHIININNKKRKIAHAKKLKLSQEETPRKNINSKWQEMFEDEGPDGALKIKRIKKNNNKISYSAKGFNDTFFKKKGMPNRGTLSPFDEIKRYDAWYWGREENLKPEIIIEKPFVSDFKKSCPCGRVKIIKTNNFYELFTSKTKNYRQRGSRSAITIDEILGNYNTEQDQDVTFLRATKYIDGDEHGYFKEYKPIGDVIITEDEKIPLGENTGCKPDLSNMENGYTNIIGKKITNLETYLVSGDTKSPIDFKFIWRYKKTHGINRGYIGLTIWEPIPPEGYVALGFVVDQRYYNETNNNDDDEQPRPSFDSIACVPEELTKDTEFTDISSDFFSSNANVNNRAITIKRNSESNTFVDNANTSNFNITIDTDSKIICGKDCDENSIENICFSENEAGCDLEKCTWSEKNKCQHKIEMPNTIRSAIKDKKYSILKLYE